MVEVEVAAVMRVLAKANAEVVLAEWVRALELRA